MDLFKKIYDMPMNEEKIKNIKYNVQQLTYEDIVKLSKDIEERYKEDDREQVIRDLRRITTVKKAFMEYDRMEREYNERNCS